MRNVPRAGLAILIAGAISIAEANDVSVVYYDISARTGTQLVHEMEAKGPVGPDGKRYPAYTRWHVAWDYQYRSGPGACKITDFTAKLEGTMTLPRWIDSESAPKSLVRSWQAMVAALRIHENGHYAHGIEAAREIGALPDSIRPAADCATLEKQINGRAQAIMDKYAALDAEYDRETRHGQTQGAILEIRN